MDIQYRIKTTVEEIRKVLNIENVVGKPIETEEMLLIPITKMGMGFGAGMGEGRRDHEREWSCIRWSRRCRTCSCNCCI